MEISDTPKEDRAPEEPKDTDEPLPGERRTRLSGAWTALVVGLLAMVVILVFILQNQQSVQVTFLMFSGHLPLAVALLFADNPDSGRPLGRLEALATFVNQVGVALENAFLQRKVHAMQAQ